MKQRENNIFYNLVRNETAVTEVFCNLMQFKSFRDVFLNYVTKKCNFEIVTTLNYHDFSTEKDLIKKDDNCLYGRADLVLNDNGIEYIFELKIEKYTKLTANQPKSYIDYLGDSSKLFFILPRGYLHVKEIVDNKSFCNYTNILYWEDIIKEIREYELDKINTYIKDFCEILDYYWFKFTKITFTKQELSLLANLQNIEGIIVDNNVPSLMKKLFTIIEDVAKKMDYQGNEDRQNKDFYGYFLPNKKYNIPDKWSLWFGVDFDIWEQENIPITIQIYSDDADEMKKIGTKFLDLKKFKYKNDEETYYIGFDKFCEDEQDYVAKLEEQISSLINEFI